MQMLLAKLFDKANLQYLLISIVIFLLSKILTWLFIEAASLYTSFEQQLLSGSIAGATWMLQIIPAMLMLKEKNGYS